MTMHDFRSIRVPSPEPLPVEFELELATVDALLSRAALAQASLVPEGLAQRVYDMSADSLAAEPASLRFVGTGETLHVHVGEAQRSIAWGGWTRLALAASLLIGAGVALWVTSRTPTGPTRIATGPQGAATDETATVAYVPDLSDLDQLSDLYPSDLSSFERKWSYLLDAAEVRSVNELSADVMLLSQQLEM